MRTEGIHVMIVSITLAVWLTAYTGPAAERADESGDDAILRAEIKAQLYEEIDTAAADINVQVDDAVASLSGVVESARKIVSLR
jgi:osmotically-inducible protein OsmY